MILVETNANEPVTYKDALRMSYELIEEKLKGELTEFERDQYLQAVRLLSNLWLRDII